ncbi:NACHT domain-containing NTPase [Nostoc sp. MS1]|uniref:NACHT domain-containing protein n=1 Tax=Nostoc sp. MS1 TaxID=2764711 RepID=UPI00295EA686|nr:NACHT domain-containing NTPase [Nostoc sp. MS1]
MAAEVGLETRQSIWKFFTGKPIDRHVFNDICSALELDTLEISQQPDVGNLSLERHESNPLDIEHLVQKLRSVCENRIQAQCSILHLLDIARPIYLHDIYVDIDVCEEITHKQWLKIEDLQKLDFDNISASFREKYQKKIGGIEAITKYTKIILLGKIGAGKTTFLQSIALSCVQGNLQADYLPIFINLKSFAEDVKDARQLSLFQYIHNYWLNYEILETELSTVLSHGRALVLLDGLDEIVGENYDKVFNKIRSFINKFYKNKIIISCRSALHDYSFHSFTELEIADFNKLKIAEFVNKWFLSVAQNSPSTSQILANKFMHKLDLLENIYILELCRTPLLLIFCCSLFQSTTDFSSHNFEIYKQALDILLVRWDEIKGIPDRQFVPNLSLLDKVKILSRIAASSFYQGDNFITGSKLQQIITDYLFNQSNITTDADALEIDSKKIIKIIELQHGLLVERARGIYSFSHLIFQEYFTAREIVARADSQTLQHLVIHLCDHRWFQVFLISMSMLKSADDLLKLIKQKIDYLAVSNIKLYHFLKWVEHKSSQVSSIYQRASVRAFYFTIALPPEHPLACNQDLAITLEHQFTGGLSIELAIDLALTHALAVSLTMTADILFARLSALNLALDLKHLLIDDLSLHSSLQYLKQQLPSATQGKESLKNWWLAHGQAWTDELRSLMINARQIGLNWHFNQQDLQDLQQYWNANKLLIDCLKCTKDISPNLRSHLETTLFLTKVVELDEK